jgi:PAS domain S-box-containing protein
MLLNGIAVITSFFVSVFAVFYKIIGYQYYYGPLYIVPFAAIVLYLNSKKKYKEARFVYMFFSLLIISYWCYEGRRNGNEYILIALASTSTIIFERKWVVFSNNFMCGLSFVIYKIYDYYEPFTPDPVINYGITPIVILLLSVAVASYSMAFYRELAYHYKNNLLDKYKELNESLTMQLSLDEELVATNEELRVSNEKLHELTKQLEVSVNQKTIELQTYINAINVNLYCSVSDLEGNFLSVNDPLVQDSGYSKDELIGQHYSILSSGKSSEHTYIQMRKTVWSGKTWRGEIKAKRKEGSHFWYDCVVIPITDATTNLKVSFLSLALPITERKLNEEAQRKTRQLLEDVAYGTSHKIRGPLARLLGLVNLIQNNMISESELKTVTEMLSVCSLEMNMATSQLVSFINDHQAYFFDLDELKNDNQE